MEIKEFLTFIVTHNLTQYIELDIKSGTSNNKRINLRHKLEPAYHNWIRICYGRSRFQGLFEFLNNHDSMRIKRLEVHSWEGRISNGLVKGTKSARAFHIFDTYISVNAISTPKELINQVSVLTLNSFNQYTKSSPTIIGVNQNERDNPLYSITKVTGTNSPTVAEVWF